MKTIIVTDCEPIPCDTCGYANGVIPNVACICFEEVSA